MTTFTILNLETGAKTTGFLRRDRVTGKLSVQRSDDEAVMRKVGFHFVTELAALSAWRHVALPPGDILDGKTCLLELEE